MLRLATPVSRVRLASRVLLCAKNSEPSAKNTAAAPHLVFSHVWFRPRTSFVRTMPSLRPGPVGKRRPTRTKERIELTGRWCPAIQFSSTDKFGLLCRPPYTYRAHRTKHPSRSLAFPRKSHQPSSDIASETSSSTPSHSKTERAGGTFLTDLDEIHTEDSQGV